jgi:hypothetical protein
VKADLALCKAAKLIVRDCTPTLESNKENVALKNRTREAIKEPKVVSAERSRSSGVRFAGGSSEPRQRYTYRRQYRFDL